MNLLKLDVLDAMEAGECIVPKDLWNTRDEYKMFDLKVFRSQLGAVTRYYREYPGWQFRRNQEAKEDYQNIVDDA